MKIFCCLVTVCGAFLLVASAFDCDSNDCHQYLNTTYHNLAALVDLFNSTTTAAKIIEPFGLEDIKNDIRQLTELEKESSKVNRTLIDSEQKLEDIRRSINQTVPILQELRRAIDNITYYDILSKKILKDAEKHKRQVTRTYKSSQEANKTCDKFRNKYVDFQKLLENIINDHNNISKSYMKLVTNANIVNNTLKAGFEETLKTKQEFDQLRLPRIILEDYLAEAEVKLNQTVDLLKNNSNLIVDLLADARLRFNRNLNFFNKSEEVRQILRATDDDLKQMNETLTTYEEAVADLESKLSVDDGLGKVLNDLDMEVMRLEETLDSLRFSDTEEKLLEDTANDEKYLEEILARRTKLKELNFLFDILPLDDATLNQIEEEIRNFELVVSLNVELNKLQEEVDELSRNRNEIRNIKCTATDQKHDGLLL